MQDHRHNVNAASSTTGDTYILANNARGGGGFATGGVSTGTGYSARVGSTTRGKSKGVIYIIKVL